MKDMATPRKSMTYRRKESARMEFITGVLFMTMFVLAMAMICTLFPWGV